MALDLNSVGNYGNGTLGDVTNPTGVICPTCAYSRALSGTDNQISLVSLSDNATMANNNDFGDWTVGSKILLVSAESTTGGKWAVRTITSCAWQYESEGQYVLIVTLNAPPNIHKDDVTGFAVKFAQYKNLTLSAGGSITPVNLRSISTGINDTPYNAGIVAIMCSETLTFDGGHIDLRNAGTTGTSNRGCWYTEQEHQGVLDTDKYSGWENTYTKDRFILNDGDGAAFIVAKEIVVADASSRIGNPATTGVAYCRGAADSYNCPSGVTNIGGSTIFMVAGTFTGFTPKLIAKYRTGTATDGKGQGLARCYIASGTKLPNDEGLYAYDNISKPSVVTDTLKIKDFGDGSSGSLLNVKRLTTPNNFAAVTAFSTNRKVLTVKNMTTDGRAPFTVGALVMVHAKNKDSTNTRNTGRFYCARILGINGNDITLDTAAPYNTFNVWLSTYYIQIITIPQYTTLTLQSRTEYDLTLYVPAWNDSKGYGGIYAVAANDTLDMRGHQLHVENCGGGAAYGANGLTHIGNAQDNDRLPVGQGHGSIFILAKHLIMDSATRIGATYSGAFREEKNCFGGAGGTPTNSSTSPDYVSGGGYRGHIYSNDSSKKHGPGGHGGGGGTSGAATQSNGGYGSNGYLHHTNFFPAGSLAANASQGAHIMIIADTITGFNQAAISTGGVGGTYTAAPSRQKVMNYAQGLAGSAGYGGGGAASHLASGMAYGGGGGYNGGGGGGICVTCDDSYGMGGGAAGWAFVYCNNVINQNVTDTDPDAIEPET